MTGRAYAIPDIHGRLDALARAHALIAADAARQGEAPVVHLGDYVDRGPESAEVVEYLRMGPARGGPWITLRGNHDAVFLAFLGEPDPSDPRLDAGRTLLQPSWGGAATLRSYGVTPEGRDIDEVRTETAARVPAEHRAFLSRLPLMHRVGAAAFVHAGIRPGIALDAQDPQDLMWIRRGFLDDPRDHGVLVVHGHTALPAPRHHGNRVNLDGGAGYGRPLAVAAVEGRDVWLLTEGGRVALLPDAAGAP